MDEPRSASLFVGVDVAKDRLDVHVKPSGEAFAVTRNGKGLDDLVDRFKTSRVAAIVLEATGGFEVTVAAAGLPVVVVNPRQIRDFARAIGRLAKTDAIDAEVIALFAERIRPEPRPVADAKARQLGEMIARRRQIVEMITMEANRQRSTTTARLVKRTARHIVFLQKELQAIDDDIDSAIKGSPAWREKEELLTSVPGVGDVTAPP